MNRDRPLRDLARTGLELRFSRNENGLDSLVLMGLGTEDDSDDDGCCCLCLNNPKTFSRNVKPKGRSMVTLQVVSEGGARNMVPKHKVVITGYGRGGILRNL